MIISHKYKFIYIKAWKVAGTTVQKALEKICGSDDITAMEETLIDGKLYDQHSTPKEIRAIVGEDIWNSYRKIVIIRNPWDALVSLYFFGHVRQKIPAPCFFNKFVWWNLEGYMPLNKQYMLMDGKRWADDYIRFENLESDCEDLFKKLGEKCPKLGREVSGHRPDIHYSLMYDRKTVDFVSKRYAEEIAEFGYKFEHIFNRPMKNDMNTIDWN